ncbi:phosphoribosyltransferase [Pontibacter actiniarum]|uniref:Phosphoribosyltransferase n=1 Tax=Pontibacter actiniarum TaxID=323450 RepID=A0A1X9YUA9_9BACT|nr:phosphoribosyltransferase family protein [Pontibacter actiniarum]ARS36475.1 phosphoribosyltransferase [Pontibacter actiniarum]
MEQIRNRKEAAELLAQRLEKYRGEQGVVLAIPRGGVPIGADIARKLGMPLEVTLAKKIGHPMNAEFAIGAVSLDSVAVDERAEVPQEYIDAEVGRIRQSLKQKYDLFMGNRQHIPLKGRVVLIVDDGIATGKTLEATIKLVGKEQPRKIVVAVPVAPPAAAAHFSQLADDFVCLLVPSSFQAVGQFYEEFGQVSDDLVIKLLQEQDAA